jgi:hypothetical protein
MSNAHPSIHDCIYAVEVLRKAARGGYHTDPEVRAAIDTLDSAEVFRPMDEAADYGVTENGS